SCTGLFTVAATHTFGGASSLTVRTTITRRASTVSVNSTATISDPAVVQSGANLIFSAGRGVSSTGIVAKFTDPGGAIALSSTPTPYTATINWGDGTATSSGTITFDSGTSVFTVLGTHNYATVSNFTITVTVHH